ncbi:MAG: hypothetical protein ACOYPS_03080 [Phycisphaerales bacterium]
MGGTRPSAEEAITTLRHADVTARQGHVARRCVQAAGREREGCWPIEA